MKHSVEIILKTNATDGENAVLGFFILLSIIIVLVCNYLTARTMNFWALFYLFPIAIIGIDIFLFELRGKEIICVFDNTLQIRHEGGIFTKKWNFKFEEVLDIKPYCPNRTVDILNTLYEITHGYKDTYKMIIVTRRKHFRHIHYCGYNMSDKAIAELKSQLENFGWKGKQ